MWPKEGRRRGRWGAAAWSSPERRVAARSWEWCLRPECSLRPRRHRRLPGRDWVWWSELVQRLRPPVHRTVDLVVLVRSAN
eukprot:5318504-Prymnesium_polylepis.2